MRTHRLPLVAAIAACLSAQAYAESPKKTFTLDKVTVAATLAEEKVGDVASSVSVVSADEIEQQLAVDIRDVLRYEAGVEVESAGRFGLSGINIRGMNENRVKIIIDGVEQAKSFIPGGDFQRVSRNSIDIDSLKQVEVVKGPASSLYGSDAIGGVVSFTTKDPADYLGEGDDTAFAAKALYASVNKGFSTTLTAANRTGDLESMLLYTFRDSQERENQGRVGGSGNSRTQTNPGDSEANNVLLKLQYQLNPKHRLEFVGEYFKTESEFELLTRNAYNDYSRYFGPGAFLEYKDSRSDDSNIRKHIGIAHSWEQNTALFDTLDWQLDLQQSETQQKTYDTLDASSVVQSIFRINPGERVKDYSHDQDTTQFQMHLRKSAGIHQLSYGLNYESTEITNNTDTLYPSGSSPNETGQYVPRVDGKNVGVYLQDKISLLDGNWTITPGVRYDEYEAKPESSDLGQHKSDKTSLKLGSVYEISDIFSVYGQFAQGFKAPDIYHLYYSRNGGTYLSLANPDLKPEESESFELGLRASGRVGEMELSVFSNRYDDFIESKRLNSDAPYTSGVTQYVNISEAKIKGAEVRASIWLDEAISAPVGTSLLASFAYSDGEGRSTNGDWEPLSTINPLKAVIGLAYDAPTGDWGSTINWTAVQKKDASDVASDSAALSKGYGVVDISAYYNVGDSLVLRASVFNLGDKYYSNWDNVRGLSANSTVLDRYTQPGRNFSISANYSF